MPVETEYGPTPWSTSELADLHGCSGGRAKEKQEEVDALIVEVLAPMHAGKRADQAAESIMATVERLMKLIAGDRVNTKKHITHLVKLANDQDVGRQLYAASRRLPVDPVESTPRKKVKVTA